MRQVYESCGAIDKLGRADFIRVHMRNISLSTPTDLEAVGARWRELEAISDPSFFQSWSWVGCLGAERFDRPVLLEANEDGKTIALALFNRHRSRFGAPWLWLGESGKPALDSIYVEHNGILVARGRGDVIAACLAAASAQGMVLSGVDRVHRDAAAAIGVARGRMSNAPFLSLEAVREAGHLAGLSANTRQQLRRSLRRYGEAGEVVLTRAATMDEALAFLDGLSGAHQAHWTGRGQAGAFACLEFARFHRALIGLAWPRSEIDLLKISAGAGTIGYLYNFRYRGRASAYQSGFHYPSDPVRKPGLTCHHLAIEFYAREGMDVYDFLAGDDRYKTSLAGASEELHWLSVLPHGSLANRLQIAIDVAGKIKSRLTGFVTANNI